VICQLALSVEKKMDAPTGLGSVLTAAQSRAKTQLESTRNADRVEKTSFSQEDTSEQGVIPVETDRRQYCARKRAKGVDASGLPTRNTADHIAGLA
jgi:hypothetical protein